MSSRRPYRSDVSDARWTLIEPVFVAWRAARTGPGAAARVHDLREIVNAILYVNRTGIPWEYLPHDFPPLQSSSQLPYSGSSDSHRARSTTIGPRPVTRQDPPISWPSCGADRGGGGRAEREDLGKCR
uniref:transposase n=1 Tax=Streptomyces violaceus TaxID=1936 RepID=UPI0035C77004